MGHWCDKLVFVRDFAYPPRARPLRMANGNIADAPAPDFAEYVNEPTPASDSALAQTPSKDDIEDRRSSVSDPTTEAASEQSRRESRRVDLAHVLGSMSYSEPDLMHPRRPPLTQRIHSQNLRVQANAYLQRARLLSGPLVDIYVGEAKRHWALHRNLLCHHSEYLASELLPSLTDHKKKGETQLDLPKDDPVGFELLVKWLYQGKIEDVSDFEDPHHKYDYAVSCHKLYLLCDRFDMPQLKNIAMDQYRRGLTEARLVPDAEEINEIYRRSGNDSPFRRLMTLIAARQIMDPDSDKNAASYRECFEDNPDFAVDLVNAIKQGTGGMLFEDPTEGEDCSYHDHVGGPNCHSKIKGRQGI